MPYPTVLPNANEQDFIFNRLLAINNAIYQYNVLSGQAFPMPPEIEVQYIAIEQFQALAVQTLEGGTNTELQSGTDTQTTTGTTTDTSAQTTTHGETVNTQDGEETNYGFYLTDSESLTGFARYSPDSGSYPFPLP